MGSAFHQLCPRYSGTLTPTAPTAIRLWETLTFTSMLLSVGEMGRSLFTFSMKMHQLIFQPWILTIQNEQHFGRVPHTYSLCCPDLMSRGFWLNPHFMSYMRFESCSAVGSVLSLCSRSISYARCLSL